MRKIITALSLLLVISCVINYVEEDIDPIGLWSLSKVEEFENIDCSGDLIDASAILGTLGFSAFYDIIEDYFTYTQTFVGITISEEGSWAINDSTLSLIGDGNIHGSKTAKISSDELSMGIIEQSDSDSDGLIDSCTKYTYSKN